MTLKKNFILFVDDTTVYLEGYSYNSVIDVLNKELQKVMLWLEANKLTVNGKKTQYMLFHRSQTKTNIHNVIMSGDVINRVASTKFC